MEVGRGRFHQSNLVATPVGGGVSAGFQAAQPIHLQGFHAGTGLQDFKLRSVLDIPIAIGHVSVIVIWSAQEQRSRMFGLDVTNLPKPTIERGFL